tara:strand:+ start:205 stop:519 length:315 start_codon:yes stop_codon:yes gene_type:complete
MFKLKQKFEELTGNEVVRSNFLSTPKEDIIQSNIFHIKTNSLKKTSIINTIVLMINNSKLDYEILNESSSFLSYALKIKVIGIKSEIQDFEHALRENLFNIVVI